MLPYYARIMPWLILAFAALSVIFLGGKRRAFGVFVAQLRVEFNQTTLAELNWIGDSYAAIGYLTTAMSTSVILASGRRFGLFQFIGACFVLIACVASAYVPNPHWLFFTHTILHGIGSSLILSTVGLVVNEHFDHSHRYHILATTLVSGGSVASIVFVQFYAYLVEVSGWRQAMIILGVLYFFVITSGALVFRKKSSLPDYQSQKCSCNFAGQIDSRQIPLLILWTVDRMITSIVTYGMLLNLTDYVHRREPSLRKSAELTTLFAAGEASTYLIGAVATAITRNLLKGRFKYILLVTTAGMTLSLAAWEVWTDRTAISYFLSYLCGFCLGPSITFLFPAGEELTHLPGHLAYPFSLAGMGMGMLLSPLVSAVIAQAFYYKWFFLVQAGLMAIKLCCLLMATWLLQQLPRTVGFNPLPQQLDPSRSVQTVEIEPGDQVSEGVSVRTGGACPGAGIVGSSMDRYAPSFSPLRYKNSKRDEAKQRRFGLSNGYDGTDGGSEQSDMDSIKLLLPDDMAAESMNLTSCRGNSRDQRKSHLVLGDFTKPVNGIQCKASPK